ncbi:ETX/MTX2 family pore-forming toxin [Paenibacillus tyrfis]|uniref:ETX/MTX2 family pore-forming toxin n=1 Tax=Paenibacillus tyrfis TaxID=1501230 RepID=UPI000B587DC3|nr:ETX/MTX2 family pore-forming toxin [Paenibacillus tyrfis]
MTEGQNNTLDVLLQDVFEDDKTLDLNDEIRKWVAAYCKAEGKYNSFYREEDKQFPIRFDKPIVEVKEGFVLKIEQSWTMSRTCKNDTLTPVESNLSYQRTASTKYSTNTTQGIKKTDSIKFSGGIKVPFEKDSTGMNGEVTITNEFNFSESTTFEQTRISKFSERYTSITPEYHMSEVKYSLAMVNANIPLKLTIQLKGFFEFYVRDSFFGQRYSVRADIGELLTGRYPDYTPPEELIKIGSDAEYGNSDILQFKGSQNYHLNGAIFSYFENSDNPLRAGSNDPKFSFQLGSTFQETKLVKVYPEQGFHVE